MEIRAAATSLGVLEVGRTRETNWLAIDTGDEGAEFSCGEERTHPGL